MSELFRPDLCKIPFSRRLSRFMLYDVRDEAPNGLYLHLSSDSPSPMRKRGLLRLVPLLDGRELEYSLAATASELKIETACGNIRICIDEPDLLRIESGGLGLRAYSPMMRMEGTVGRNDGSFELSYAGTIGKILINTFCGSMTFNSKWRLFEWKPEDVVCDMLPDQSGSLKVAIHQYVANELPRDSYRPFEDCASEAAEDYLDWLSLYRPVAGKYSGLKNMAAYTTWICMQRPERANPVSLLGGNMIMSRRYDTDKANLFEQIFHALSFGSAEAAFEALCSTLRLQGGDGMLPAWANDIYRQYGYAPPPLCALLLDQMLSSGAADKIDDARWDAVYKPLCDWAGWWLTYRDGDKDLLCAYSYSAEPGISTDLFADGLPVESPDLAAYLVLFTEALGKLGERLGKPDAEQWTELSEQLFVTLLHGLWDGEKFAFKASGSHKPIVSDNILSYIPLILGDWFPEEITEPMISSLLEKEAWQLTRDIPIVLLPAIGLISCKRGDAAQKICEWFIGIVEKHGLVNTVPGENEAGEPYSSWCAAALLTMCAMLDDSKEGL